MGMIRIGLWNFLGVGDAKEMKMNSILQLDYLVCGSSLLLMSQNRLGWWVAIQS